MTGPNAPTEMPPTDRPPRRWDRYWHTWLLAVSTSFAALEAAALRQQGERATLTAHLRHHLGVSPRRRHCRAGQALMLAVFGWCALHLVGGWLPSDGWLDDGSRVPADNPTGGLT